MSIPTDNIRVERSRSARAGGAVDQWGDVHLSMPFPLSTNRLYRAVGRRSILSEAYRAWKAEAAQALMLQRAPRLNGPVRVHLRLNPPNKRRFDLDNKFKAALDALVAYGVIEADDNTIVRSLHVECGDIGSAAPACVVTIIPLGEA